MRQPSHWTRSEKISAARCVIAVPAAFLAIVTLRAQLADSQHTTFGLALLYLALGLAILSGMAVACKWGRAAAAKRYSLRRARSADVAHRDQISAREEAKFYSTAMTEQPSLLGLSAWHIARNANIPLVHAWALMRNPLIVPRPDLWQDLERALFLPSGYFKRGSAKGGAKYGDKITTSRIHWILDRNLVPEVRLKKNDPRMKNAQARGCFLLKLETMRRMDLGQAIEGEEVEQ